MSDYDTTAASEWMQETYSQKDYFKPYVEDYTPVLSDFEECPDEPVKGKRWNVLLYLATARNVRTGPEGGAQAGHKKNTAIQGQVNAIEFKGTVKVTELLDRQGVASAHFNGGALNQQMDENTSDLAKHMQIMLWGHGTARLGVVDATVVANNVVKTRLPDAWTRFYQNQEVDFYDLDTGGTKQGSSVTVTRVNRAPFGDSSAAGYNTYAGELTLSANVSVTAGWGIYPKDDYGYAPNGITGLIGSESLAGTFLTKSRATYPGLNTHRSHASGVPRDIAIDHMNGLADDIWLTGKEIDSIRGNGGVLRAYQALHTNDKRYGITKGEYPKYIGGFREGDLLFAHDKVTAVIKKDPNCPLRTMKFLALRDTFHKHTSAELGFLNRGGNILLPLPSTGGGGYDYAFTARLYAALNVSCHFPGGNGSYEDIKDPMAGD